MGLFSSSVNHIVKLTNDKCTAVIYCRVCMLCFYVCAYVCICLFVWLMYVYVLNVRYGLCALNSNNTDDVIVIVIDNGRDAQGIKRRRMGESKVAQTREYHVNARNQSYEA